MINVSLPNLTWQDASKVAMFPECVFPKAYMPPFSETPIPIEIDVESVKKLLDSESDFLLIDCREPDEHEFCRIESAKLIPMNETPARVGELETHRDSQIVVHCHHGGRSMQVVQWLRSQGFSGAQNMTGGIEVWSQLIDPEVPRY